MKIRTGFVSNSSSSSFVLDRNKMTALQIEQIYHVEETLQKIKEQDSINLDKKFGCCESEDIKDWTIEEDGNRIVGHTCMDNFDMVEFVNYIGANKAFIERDHSNFMWIREEEDDDKEEEWKD